TDNDCNGTPDQKEPACTCSGGVGQGGSQSCFVPGAVGVCASGSRVCQPSPDKSTGVYGPCIGPPPAARQCTSAADYDCNGISDELDVGCGTPCLDPLGSGAQVAAVQKFSAGMYGCRGRRTYAVRASACSGNSFVCATTNWTNYIRTAN